MSEPGHSPGFEVSRVRGNPTAEEHDAILDALVEFLAQDHQAAGGPAATRLSAWKLAGRLAARRGGILDVASSLGRSAWPASARIPWAGRAHQGRVGRGESR